MSRGYGTPAGPASGQCAGDVAEDAAGATSGAPVPAPAGAGADGRPAGRGRPEAVDFEDPHFERRAYDPWTAYGQSKTAGAPLTVGARRWAADGATA
ncbi:hypothetical protein [Streptomyces laurentii]|uniref:hypothetical protein n=1 Tax=Streptomyces laurentii TaxID=39478 RepID=UPI003F4CDD20